VKLCWLLPSLLSTFLLSATAEAAKLEYWRFNAEQSRLDLITSEAVQPKAILLLNPARLVIDLPGTTFGRPTVYKAIGRWVREVRAAQANPQTTRLVIELGPEYTLRPQEVRIRGIAPNRWFVQLPKLQPLALGPQRSVVIPVPLPKQPPSQDPGVPRPRPNVRVVVVVDPGHGGQDPGAIGIGGLREKDVILPIALEVARLLERQGVNAVLTRADDRFVDLAPRVALAEAARATLFVSIHANAISLSRPDVNGLETYYAPGSSSGARLAQTIHSSILRTVRVRDRGVRQARFYVLRKTSMPATLVEVGFVTGREDAANLRSVIYRGQLAQAIAEGILRYVQFK